MSDHTFNPFIAKKYGINEAIFLNTIIFWTRTNAAKNKNFHDDRYWTYGTPEFYANYFPYFKPRLIKDIIASCIKQNALIKGGFNEKKYDRTAWYSLSNNVLSELDLDVTCLKPKPSTIVRITYDPLDGLRTMDRTDYVPPIPDSKTDSKHSSSVRRKDTAPHTTVVNLLKSYGIPVPKRITKHTIEIINAAEEVLRDKHKTTIDSYLDFLYKTSRNWIEPYFKNGKEIRNDFKIILRPALIERAMNAEFEDK